MATTSVSLYDAEVNLEALAECVETITPEQEQQFLADFGAALLAAAEKRDRVAFYLLHLEQQAGFAKAEIKRLQDRKASYERAQERLEHYVIHVIEELGVDAKGKFRILEGKTSTLKLAGLPPSVEITDEAKVPLDFKHVSVKLPAKLLETMLDALDLETRAVVMELLKKSEASLDKKAIKAAFDAKQPVEGADLNINGHRLVVV